MASPAAARSPVSASASPIQRLSTFKNPSAGAASVTTPTSSALESLASDPIFSAFLSPSFSSTSFSSGSAASTAEKLHHAIRLLENQLRSEVFSRHHDLLSQLSSLHHADHALSTLRSALSSLQSSVRRLRSELSDPHRSVAAKTTQLSNLHLTTELLQHSIRALRLSKKLRDLMAVDPEKLGLAKAAQLHYEILSLCNEYDLGGIDAVDEEINWVRETGDLLRSEAMKVLERGMEGLNQAEVGTGLQVFYNLGELKVTVEQVVNKYKGLGAKSVSVALDMKAVTGGSGYGPGGIRGSGTPHIGGGAKAREALWHRLGNCMDQLHSIAVAVWHLQRVLSKKRDPFSHVLLLDEVIQNAFLAHCLSRLSDLVNSVFPMSSRGSVPSKEQISRIISRIQEEIEAVQADARLTLLVLHEIGKVLIRLVERAEYQVSSLELAQLPGLCKDKRVPCIVYIQQIGYLMCIFEEKPEETTLEKLVDWEYIFCDTDGETKRYFYRTPKTRELDSLLGDIHHKILDMERAITRDLFSRILLFQTHLIKVATFAAELDCFLSMALVARQNNYVRPSLTEENLLDIKNGRHVLQEMTVDTFIPNDTKILHDGRINIITGPNFSGKSIYIKQVAIIVFLSHIGSFVPADAATVGLTDRIFCATGSRLMTAEQSTFMIDLHQIGMMLRHATSQSLCLVDEFGKGTLTEDGIGLLAGTINHFVTCDEPPKKGRKNIMDSKVVALEKAVESKTEELKTEMATMEAEIGQGGAKTGDDGNMEADKHKLKKLQWWQRGVVFIGAAVVAAICVSGFVSGGKSGVRRRSSERLKLKVCGRELLRLEFSEDSDE